MLNKHLTISVILHFALIPLLILGLDYVSVKAVTTEINEHINILYIFDLSCSQYKQ